LGQYGHSDRTKLTWGQRKEKKRNHLSLCVFVCSWEKSSVNNNNRWNRSGSKGARMMIDFDPDADALD
jgi:hypothetical protein